ncbi:tripartite tricarboxylate transporter TctB family protein [Symbiobacterium thermophilum]|uniref:DUF1468 domain-containing protein n=1 Tax=Symbiobacterium thermophilum (strain DSM 24528 / JCM 14929 / IAM 14863 / T) TaxID=292459 RepID=Q67M78_SYMTH|nr:tripartite tricarboxylate transporter TctB family protein [Symbiobacterium thermophilum]BAD41215.1 conserved hypothetical protein [Symbiobacterium thermophilum IAM 14863]
MKKHDRIGAVVLIVIGVAAAVYSVIKLKVGTLRVPGSGFMPLLASLAVIGGSIGWLWEVRGPDPDPRPLWPDKNWLRPLLGLLFLILYALLFKPLGHLFSTLVFLGLWQFLVERVNWRRATLVTLLGAAGMYLLFVVLLGVHVPTSPLGL